MSTYAEFCKHYEYDPTLESSKKLYNEYMKQLAFFNKMLAKEKLENEMRK